MSERLIEQLSRLTPDGAGLDRDALLFAAGRASARPARGWKVLAGLLAASQLAMLLWLRPMPVPAPAPAPVPLPEVAVPLPAPEPPAGLRAGMMLMHDPLRAESPEARPGDVESFAPSEPPLHACAGRPVWLRE